MSDRSPSRGSAEDAEKDAERTREYFKQANVGSLAELRERRERYIRESLPFWKECVAGDVRQVLEQGSAHDRDRLQRLWWQCGVPPSLRGAVWLQTLPNGLNITRDLYNILVQQSKRIKASLAPDDPSASQLLGKMGSVKLITFDVPRTFKLLQFFQPGGPMHESLKSVLEAYVCYRPDWGYVQGMTFLVAVLLLNMDEADAFSGLCNLLNMPLLRVFYSLDMDAIKPYTEAVDDLVRHFLPRLGQHFSRVGVSSEMYVLDWVMTLFSKALNLEVAVRIWDLFFLEGERLVFRAVLGVLKTLQSELLKSSFEDCLKLLMNVPQDLVPESVVENVASIPLTERKWVSDVMKKIKIKRTCSLR